MDIIKQCYEMKQYDAPNKSGYRTFYVMNGDYILRKTKDKPGVNSDPKTSIISIHVYFSRLNDILEKRHHSKTLDQRYLARNCEYIKVYNYCKTHPKFNLAELSFGNGKGPLADIIGRKLPILVSGKDIKVGLNISMKIKNRGLRPLHFNMLTI